MNAKAHPILDYAECAIERKAQRFSCEHWQTLRCWNVDGAVCPDCPALIRIDSENKRRSEFRIPKFWIAWAVIALSFALLGAMTLGVIGMERYHQYEISESRI